MRAWRVHAVFDLCGQPVQVMARGPAETIHGAIRIGTGCFHSYFPRLDTDLIDVDFVEADGEEEESESWDLIPLK